MAASIKASLKEQVAGVASPALSGVARPQSRGATSKRRPAPKVITEDALQLSPTSRKAQGLDFSLGELLAQDIYAPLPASRKKKTQGEVRTHSPRSPVASMLEGNSAAALSASASELLGCLAQAHGSPNPHCTISADRDGTTEIRTKVFRMGAPLLRTSIPVSLGLSREGRRLAEEQANDRTPKAAHDEEDGEGSDMETILSLSDIGVDDQGTLSVTLDFPC